MSEEQLAYIEKRYDGVAYIVLNQPRKKNAMSHDMMVQLRACIQDAEDDEDVRCVILKGADGCFCSGGDLSGMASGGSGSTTVEQKRRNIADFGKCIAEMVHGEKPYIAQVEGYAMGGGFSLALGCDMIFAGENAKMSSMFTHVGLAPEMGAMLFLPQAMGAYRAKELWYSGRKVNGTEGYELGFVSRVFPDDALEDETLAMAQHIAELPRTALGAMKRTVNGHIYSDIDAVLAADVQDSPLCMMSDESLAYLKANFMKK
ncbi:enoyl-CoA hydratase/isomerase family protein [Adlercreutzia sp. R21]|uniref:enoyl-CoA hydratase/isomerase family protein n=1 Tax=Adlercreutzia wanghongyangiae TaxID=3111451 RepID=UPI002DBE3852|nr:enoyl-CoA hydratase/isomerase family protein [Adlercreutzia sp. R21]MEC4183268.1 enoyl-CoA hydratase/isomerase family protein [Adlercreutzia sp. R21]